jgi:ferredoxin-like protein FixX
MINYKELTHRTGDTGEFISIILENCKGCRKCEIICPMDIWKVVDKKARLNADYKELCLECGHCYSICENDAIVFQFPKGGTGVIYKHG